MAVRRPAPRRVLADGLGPDADDRAGHRPGAPRDRRVERRVPPGRAGGRRLAGDVRGRRGGDRPAGGGRGGRRGAAWRRAGTPPEGTWRSGSRDVIGFPPARSGQARASGPLRRSRRPACPTSSAPGGTTWGAPRSKGCWARFADDGDRYATTSPAALAPLGVPAAPRPRHGRRHRPDLAEPRPRGTRPPRGARRARRRRPFRRGRRRPRRLGRGDRQAAEAAALLTHSRGERAGRSSRARALRRVRFVSDHTDKPRPTPTPSHHPNSLFPRLRPPVTRGDHRGTELSRRESRLLNPINR